MSELITFTKLTGKPEEMEALAAVLNSVPDYTRRCRGEEQGPMAPSELLEKLPEGFDPELKTVFGIYFNHRMVGCLDVLRGFPDAKTALIGVLLISEDVQGAGLGSEAFKEIEKEIRTWEGIEKIRIGILRSNDFVQNFWRKMGFRKMGETQPYESGSLRTKMFFMERSLKAFSKSSSGPHKKKRSGGPRSNNHRSNHAQHNNSHSNNGHQSSEAKPAVAKSEEKNGGTESVESAPQVQSESQDS